jgi:ABC-type transport system involved in multi-copper enzyme maturation permease subunit
MAFWALLEADLKVMAGSWVVRIWGLLLIAQILVTIPTAATQGTAAISLSDLLGTFPLIWAIVVILNSAGAVSSETGVVADSILSKAITRYEYILAKLISRLLTNLLLYLISALTAAYLLSRYAIENNLDTTGAAYSISLIGMLMVLVTSLGVAFSTFFDRSAVAIVVTWILWMAAGGIFALFKLENLSPVHILDRLPDALAGEFSARAQWEALIGFTLASSVVIGAAIMHYARKDL